MHKKIVPFLISLVIIFAPMFVIGAEIKFSGLAPICNTEIDTKNGGFVDHCDFNVVIATINNAINYFIKYLATPLFAILFVYAGVLYITAGGSSKDTDKAKKILINSVVGYLIALASWLIIDTIVKGLDYNGPSYLSS